MFNPIARVLLGAFLLTTAACAQDAETITLTLPNLKSGATFDITGLRVTADTTIADPPQRNVQLVDSTGALQVVLTIAATGPASTLPAAVDSMESQFRSQLGAGVTMQRGTRGEFATLTMPCYGVAITRHGDAWVGAIVARFPCADEKPVELDALLDAATLF